MANTRSAEYRFTVKEGEASASGRPDAPVSLLLEPTNGELAILSGGFMSLRLAPGTTVDEAQQLSKLLEEKIAAVSFTTL